MTRPTIDLTTVDQTGPNAELSLLTALRRAVLDEGASMSEWRSIREEILDELQRGVPMQEAAAQFVVFEENDDA